MCSLYSRRCDCSFVQRGPLASGPSPCGSRLLRFSRLRPLPAVPPRWFQFTARLALVVDFGNGLLPSLVAARDRLANARSKPECMTDPALAPMRKFLQNHFPTLPNDKVRRPLQDPLCVHTNRTDLFRR
jgi:hypothetical protein